MHCCSISASFSWSTHFISRSFTHTNASLHLSGLNSIHFLYLIKLYARKIYVSENMVFKFQILSYHLIHFSGARLAFNSGFELWSTSLFQAIEFIRMDTHNMAQNENVRNRKLNRRASSGGGKKRLVIWGD